MVDAGARLYNLSPAGSLGEFGDQALGGDLGQQMHVMTPARQASYKMVRTRLVSEGWDWCSK
jgi:hypothetical protein